MATKRQPLRKPKVEKSPIHAFGLFWKVDEIDWFPGKGKKDSFQLLGRQGKNTGKIRMADFRRRQGIYILYGNYGPHYAGLTRKQTLGKRLKDHLSDEHKDAWDRFSWFGFKQVLGKKNPTGMQLQKDQMPKRKSVDPNTVIKEMEALLIKSMALRNRQDSKFVLAKEWHQVRQIDKAKLIERL
jgi:hypothetical protein